MTALTVVEAMSHEALTALLENPAQLTARLQELGREEAIHREAAARARDEIERLASLSIERRARTVAQRERDLDTRERALDRRAQALEQREQVLEKQRQTFESVRAFLVGSAA